MTLKIGEINDVICLSSSLGTREREGGREKRKPGERVWPTTVMIYGALSDN